MFNLSLYTVIARAIVLLTSIPVHEAAHAWVASKMGDDTARYGKRLSLNPFDHIDPVGALMILLVGVGWAKPVPVNSFHFKDRKMGIILTSLAGPASNILLALVSLVLYRLLRFGGMVMPQIFDLVYGPVQVLQIMVFANITLAVFNLLPIPPLDGWRVASVLLPPRLYWQIAEKEQMIGMALMLIVFAGLLNGPLGFLSSLLYMLVDKIALLILFPVQLLF